MSGFFEYGFVLTWWAALIFSLLMGIFTALTFQWGVYSERARARRCQRLRRKIAALSYWQKQCIELHGDGYNVLEIAGMLQLPPDHVMEELTAGYAIVRKHTALRPPLRVRVAWACKTFVQLVTLCGSMIFRSTARH